MDRYAGVDNFNEVSIQGSFLNFAVSQSENEEDKKTLQKISKIRAIWSNDFNPVSYRDLNQLRKELRRDHFEDLVTIQEGSANVNFLIRENGNTITDVTLIVDDEDQFLLINLEGKLKFKDLGDINLDIEGMDHFKNLPKDRSKLKRA